MRTFRFVAVSLSIIFFLILGIGVSNVKAGTYLGELCWEIEMEGKTPFVMKYAVTDMGNGHFLLNGKGTTPDGYVGVCHGNAELVEDKIYMELIGTINKEHYLVVGNRSVILDLPGLDGTTEVIGTFYDRNTGEIKTGYTSGTFTFVSCPE
jgi:hypothetical protein